MYLVCREIERGGVYVERYREIVCMLRDRESVYVCRDSVYEER